MKQKMILVLLMITMLTSCSTAGGNDHQETTLRSLFGDRFLIGTALNTARLLGGIQPLYRLSVPTSIRW